jgi:hypothetical protein
MSQPFAAERLSRWGLNDLGEPQTFGGITPIIRSPANHKQRNPLRHTRPDWRHSETLAEKFSSITPNNLKGNSAPIPLLANWRNRTGVTWRTTATNSASMPQNAEEWQNSCPGIIGKYYWKLRMLGLIAQNRQNVKCRQEPKRIRSENFACSKTS